MKSLFSQSLGNVSRDSGVLVQQMAKPGSHSRSVSNASSNYTTTTYNEEQERRSCKINRKWLFILLGLFLLFLSSLSYAYFPIALTRIIQTYINIKPNQEFYNFWIQSTEPTEVGIFLFHIENPWAVENGLEKLKVREMGKYMFKWVHIFCFTTIFKTTSSLPVAVKYHNHFITLLHTVKLRNICTIVSLCCDFTSNRTI